MKQTIHPSFLLDSLFNMKYIGRAPQIGAYGTWRTSAASSTSAYHRHTRKHTYRCSLPGLTGFGSITLRWTKVSTPLTGESMHSKGLSTASVLL